MFKNLALAACLFCLMAIGAADLANACDGKLWKCSPWGANTTLGPAVGAYCDYGVYPSGYPSTYGGGSGGATFNISTTQGVEAESSEEDPDGDGYIKPPKCISRATCNNGVNVYSRGFEACDVLITTNGKWGRARSDDAATAVCSVP